MPPRHYLGVSKPSVEPDCLLDPLPSGLPPRQPRVSVVLGCWEMHWPCWPVEQVLAAGYLQHRVQSALLERSLET